jgi:hypothetical protein
LINDNFTKKLKWTHVLRKGKQFLQYQVTHKKGLDHYFFFGGGGNFCKLVAPFVTVVSSRYMKLGKWPISLREWIMHIKDYAYVWLDIAETAYPSGAHGFTSTFLWSYRWSIFSFSVLFCRWLFTLMHLSNTHLIFFILLIIAKCLYFRVCPVVRKSYGAFFVKLELKSSYHFKCTKYYLHLNVYYFQFITFFVNLMGWFSAKDIRKYETHL